MRPVGNTYLIQQEKKGDVEMLNGFFIPVNFGDCEQVQYIGKVVAYGTKVDMKNPDLVPIGTKVIYNYMKKNGISITIKGKKYFVKDVDNILGIIEE